MTPREIELLTIAKLEHEGQQLSVNQRYTLYAQGDTQRRSKFYRIAHSALCVISPFWQVFLTCKNCLSHKTC
ncbi:Uncharacterised protein [Yersinia mollaretii]|uniref:Uncharacterized protein n=1 Tax=Yersinia mollaretii TaxID=33060 RepID=A0AA36LUB7_YERMO|nr:Uncharacterised protein [Yersinia mollaretii]